MVHQHFMLVDTMTVAENIILGAETGGAANLDLEKANRDILSAFERIAARRQSESVYRRYFGRRAAARRTFKGALPQRRAS